jgi:hypothetical protein
VLFKSSPPLLGTNRPFYILPKRFLHCRPIQRIFSWKIAWVVLISDFGYADEEAAGEYSDGEQSPSASTDTQAGHPKGTRSAVRKRCSSSQTTSDR